MKIIVSLNLVFRHIFTKKCAGLINKLIICYLVPYSSTQVPIIQNFTVYVYWLNCFIILHMTIGTCICKKQWLQHQILIILQKISCNTINELLIAWGVILKGNILWANWLLYNPLMAIIDKVVSIIQYQSLHFSFHLCSKGYLGFNRRHLFKKVSILEGIFRRRFYSTGTLLLKVFS